MRCRGPGHVLRLEPAAPRLLHRLPVGSCAGNRDAHLGPAHRGQSFRQHQFRRPAAEAGRNRQGSAYRPVFHDAERRRSSAHDPVCVEFDAGRTRQAAVR